MLNPKNTRKNGKCIYSAFIDGNIFGETCEKHKGLFSKI